MGANDCSPVGGHVCRTLPGVGHAAPPPFLFPATQFLRVPPIRQSVGGSHVAVKIRWWHVLSYRHVGKECPP